MLACSTQACFMQHLVDNACIELPALQHVVYAELLSLVKPSIIGLVELKTAQQMDSNSSRCLAQAA